MPSSHRHSHSSINPQARFWSGGKLELLAPPSGAGKFIQKLFQGGYRGIFAKHRSRGYREASCLFTLIFALLQCELCSQFLWVLWSEFGTKIFFPTSLKVLESINGYLPAEALNLQHKNETVIKSDGNTSASPSVVK